jgi:hypothetical protein
MGLFSGHVWYWTDLLFLDARNTTQGAADGSSRR